MRFLAHWYSHRTVNVNVNIVLAGIIALAITVGVMHPLEVAGVHRALEDRTGLDHKLIIGGLTFLVDIVADVLVYYGLHWLANHWPGRIKPKLLNPAYANMTFMKDATLVQFERILLAPIFYVVALGLQHFLLLQEYSVALATVVGFGTGIAITRTLHTIWMLRADRRALIAMQASEDAALFDSLPADVPEAVQPFSQPQAIPLSAQPTQPAPPLQPMNPGTTSTRGVDANPTTNSTINPTTNQTTNITTIPTTNATTSV